MKKSKRISALLLCVLMLCSTVLLCACQDKPEQPESTDATYKVTVVDGLGKPYTEKIIVKFLQDGKQAAMAPIGTNGTVEKTLPKGDYTVELDATGDSDCYYDTASAKLTADKTELTITMAYMAGENTTTIYANSVATGENTGYEALNIGIGSVYVSLDTADRTYFLFTPTEAGTYQFSTTGGSTVIGYFGAPHFVQGSNVGTVENNILSVSVSASMISSGATGTSVYVIGVDSVDGTTNTILNVVRSGDPAWSIADEPWSVYQPKQEIKDFTLPEGTELTDFDVTASTDTYVLVLNEQDHCYHLGTVDGPVVYVNLEKAVYGISMLTMVGENIFDADGVPIESGSSPFRYVRDNGPDDFFKEEYTDVTRRIITARDKTTGVYPLTEDLHYILKMGVDAMGWARKGTMNYLFNSEPGVNEEIAWMFLMCHAQADNTGDNTGDNIGDSTGDNTGDNTGGTTGGNTGGTTGGNTGGSTGGSTGGNTGGTTGGNTGGSTGGNTGGSTGGNTGGTTRPDPIVDNKDDPIIPVPEETGLSDNSTHFEATIQANHETYFNLYRIVTAVNLTINNKDAYVIYNGKTYEAKNGVVTVPGIKSQYTNSPVEIVIGNKGTAEATFDVKLTHPAGTQGNPHKLKLGKITTDVAKNNEMGVFYTWTATKNGTLTLTLDKVTNSAGKDVQAGITVTVTDSSMIPIQYGLEDGKTTITVEVKAGDNVSVIISVLPNEKNQYLAATIDVTVSLN